MKHHMLFWTKSMIDLLNILETILPFPGEIFKLEWSLKNIMFYPES